MSIGVKATQTTDTAGHPTESKRKAPSTHANSPSSVAGFEIPVQSNAEPLGLVQKQRKRSLRDLKLYYEGESAIGK